MGTTGIFQILPPGIEACKTRLDDFDFCNVFKIDENFAYAKESMAKGNKIDPFG